MAWISVHEQVIGGKLRNLAKEIGCSQNEALGLLVRLWLWGINNADKEGKIFGASKDDIAEILTIGLDRRYSSEAAVSALVSEGWIDIDGDLYIHDWEEWQEQWYKAIEVRERDAARKREERRRKRSEKSAGGENLVERQDERKENEAPEGMEENLTASESIIPQDEIGKSKPDAIAYPKDFEDFWNIYPRKLGKGEAYKKYRARLKDGWGPEELKRAAMEYAAVCIRKKTEKEYIKHAKTFLSESTPFSDYLPKNSSPDVITNVSDDDPYADWRRG